MKIEYTRIHGGLDLSTPAMSVPSGRAQLAVNYEAGDTGGLRRIDGYERFDGRSAPSAAVYYYCTVTFSGTVVAGDTITGATSGKTGVVIEVGATYLTFTKSSGTFTADEVLNVAASPVATLVGLPELNGHRTGLASATALYLAAEKYRADIAKPTGSGPVRGGGKLNGVLYVFRDNAGGTACDLWKATTSGWTQITLFHEISFTTGTAAISDGQTITQLVSTASALVKRVVLQSGTWAGGDAAGRLIITTITGTFDATNALQVGGVTKATASSLATAITILPGGKYETAIYNFRGSSNTRRMYGVDGVNRGFEFDGTTYVPISTGATTDTPTHMAAHKRHLFFTYRASLQNSSLGEPYQWSFVTGANDKGMGEDIKGLSVLVGEVLAVVGQFSVNQLTGNTTSDFKMNTLAPDSGGREWSLDVLGTAGLMVNNHGVVKILPSQAYGNFDQSTASRDVQELIDDIRDIIVGAAVYRSRNQYRVYGSDGTGIIATASAEKRGTDWVSVFYFTRIVYPVSLNCVISCEDDTTYLCDSTGWVFQSDKGNSFDGADIERYFRLAFNHSKSPTTTKSYRRAEFEMTATGYSSIRVHPEFTYGDPRHAQHRLDTLTTQGLGGRWDVDNWDEFYWDSRIVSSPSVPLRGNGENMAMVVYSKDAIDQGHKIDGITIHYLPRSIQR